MSAKSFVSKRTNFFVGLTLVIAAVFIILLCLDPAGGERGDTTTWYVDDDAEEGGNGSLERPFNIIQDAVDNAAEGDTIRVFEGTFNENLILSKSILFQGNGSEETMIKSRGGDIVVRVTSDSITIRGFTVTLGETGILVESDHNTISENSIENNALNGIYLDGANYNTVSKNFCTLNGWYGIDLDGSSNNSIVDNVCNKVGKVIDGFGIILDNPSVNNTIEGNLCENNSDGIRIYGDYNLVGNNKLLNNYHGLYFRGDHSTIQGNNISGNHNGIGVYYCENNTIHNNTISNNERGIDFDNADNCTIIGNYLTNNRFGIFLEFVDGVFIMENTCRDSMDGMYLWYTRYAVLERNQMNGGGVNLTKNDLEYWNTHTIDPTNTVNGKSMYYLKNATGSSVPSDAGQVIITNCTDIAVEDVDISGSNVGIIGTYSSDIHIGNVSCSGNTIAGIHFISTTSSIISNSSCVNNDIGIILDDCTGHVLRNNTCSNNRIGIEATGAPFLRIMGTECSENQAIGIFLKRSDASDIMESKMEENAIGIYLTECKSTDAHYNIIQRNPSFGVLVENNTIFDVDARYNWWGHDSGPHHGKNEDGKGDEVSNNIEFDPWLTEHPGEPKTWYVDDDAADGGDGSQDRPFNLIQDAVETSQEGNTIRVFAGDYSENVYVNTSVSIVGNGSDSTTLRDADKEVCVMEINADWVSITGFHITGARSQSPNDTAGIRLLGNHTHIHGNRFTDNDNGILVESANNMIENNIFGDNNLTGTGILMFQEFHFNEKVHHNRIMNNAFTDCWMGIAVSKSTDNDISGNTLSWNAFGISEFGSWRDTIDSNICENNGRSLAMSYSYHTKVLNNSLSGFIPDDGDNDSHSELMSEIGMFDCSWITLENNTISAHGIYLSGDYVQYWNTHTIDEMNTVNGKPIVYVANQTGGSVANNAGQIILTNCSSVLIENYENSGSLNPIQIGHCRYITVRNTSLSHHGTAIGIHHSTFLEITNNSIMNSRTGISLTESNDNQVSLNTILDSDLTGISLYRSDDNEIFQNTVRNAQRGIRIYLSDAATVHSNAIQGNEQGLYLYASDITYIGNNSIEENYYGIQMEVESKENEVHQNNITGSAYLGIDASNNYGHVVHAEYNWWGDDSGPFHLLKNPGGRGDEVSDYVEFDPWTGKKEDNHDLPDLILMADWIEFTPSEPIEGEDVNIRVRIFNIGDTRVEDVYMKLYSQDSYGVQGVFGTMLVGDIPARSSINETVTWNTSGYFGNHTIHVHVDHDDLIEEIYESNNEMIMPLYIVPQRDGYAIQLEVDRDSIVLHDTEPSTIGIYMKNTGLIHDIYTIEVRFMVGGALETSSTGWDIQIPKGPISLQSGQTFVLTSVVERNSTIEEPSHPDQLVVIVTSNTYSNVTASRIVEVSLSHEKDGSDSSIIPAPPAPLTGVVVVSVGLVAFAGLLSFHEPGRFRFFLFLLPMYTRLKKESLEELENRREILGFIKGRPGVNYTTVMRSLGIGNGTLTYHLKVLEDNRVIKSRIDTNKKRFYPYKHQITEKEERIIEILRANPGLNQKDIVRILRMNRRKAGRKLNELVESGQVRIEKVGRENHYFIQGAAPTGSTDAPKPLTGNGNGNREGNT